MKKDGGRMCIVWSSSEEWTRELRELGGWKSFRGEERGGGAFFIGKKVY